MMNRMILIVAGAAAVTCAKKPELTPEPVPEAPVIQNDDNPFFAGQWETPFGVPPFGDIEEKHYAPALDEGMKRHLEEIDAIAANPETPTFANTIVELEKSGQMLERVARVFGILGGTDLTDGLKALRKEYNPKLAKHSDAIALNEALFARIEKIHAARDTLGLSAEQLKLVEDYYDDFVRAGATLKGEAKERVKAINAELATLFNEFSTRALENNKQLLLIENDGDLIGLPEEVKAAGATLASERGHEGKWAFGLVRSSYEPFMKYAENRERRQELWELFHNRGSTAGPTDTRAIGITIATLRAERAALFGFPNHAAYRTDGLMAGTPEAVYSLMGELLKGSLVRMKEDRATLTSMLQKDIGKKAELEPWDWRFYAERLRKAKYELSEEELKPYFEVNAVRDGAFATATKLFGITFDEITADVPLYNPEAKVFKVKDSDGSHVGLLYVDYFPRESKRSGAWCTEFRSQSKVFDEDIRPVVLNVGNFPKPTGNKPALLGWSEVETLFHEFGHALHNLLSDVTYPRFAGTSVKRDYVEFPSQVLENWASVPAVMKTYAKHYETGEAIPDALIEKIRKSSNFNEGFSTGEYVAAALLDLEWHTKDVEAMKEITDVNAFDRATMKKLGMIDEIAPRYYSPYFQHIFASDGYASGYYVYGWSDVLGADAYKAFEEAGDAFDPALAGRLRKYVFSAGGSAPEMELYTKFRGQEPSVQALLEARGLVVAN
ncbi:MAG: M3 family metallopeptidase [Myxococcota bacterium]